MEFMDRLSLVPGSAGEQAWCLGPQGWAWNLGSLGHTWHLRLAPESMEGGTHFILPALAEGVSLCAGLPGVGEAVTGVT